MKYVGVTTQGGGEDVGTSMSTLVSPFLWVRGVYLIKGVWGPRGRKGTGVGSSVLGTRWVYLRKRVCAGGLTSVCAPSTVLQKFVKINGTV